MLHFKNTKKVVLFSFPVLIFLITGFIFYSPLATQQCVNAAAIQCNPAGAMMTTYSNPTVGTQWTNVSGGVYYNSGNVGIGMSSTPGQKLSVAGTLGIQEAGGGTDYTIFQGGTQAGNVTYTLPTAAPSSNGQVLSATTAGVLSWQPDATGGVSGWSYSSPNVSLTTSGDSVGIGTSTPAHKLHVYGATGSALMLVSNTTANGYTFFQDNGGGANNSYYSHRITTNMHLLSSNKNGSGTLRKMGFSVGGGDNEADAKLVIDTNGSVGIGTTTPGALLDVYKTGINDPLVRLGSADTAGGPSLVVRNGSGDISLFVSPFADGFMPGTTVGDVGIRVNGPTINDIFFGSPVTTFMTIKSSGNVGIGTATPGAKLEVAGQIKITGGTPGAGKVLTSDSTGLATWETGGGGGGGGWTQSGTNVYTSGNDVGIGITTPNRRLEISRNGLRTEFSLGENLFLDGQGATVRITNNAYVDSTGAWAIKDATARAATIEIRDTGVVDIYGTVTAGATNWSQMLGIDAPNNKVLFPNGNVGIGTPAPNTILDIAGALSVRGMAAPAVSPAGQGRIYFDSTANVFKVSENGGAYVNLVGGGGGSGDVTDVGSCTTGACLPLDSSAHNIGLGTQIIFEGITSDAFETTISATDPIADRTITVPAPNTDGTIALVSTITTSSGPVQTPVATHMANIGYTPTAWHSNLNAGYRFTPNINGNITKFGCFGGSQSVSFTNAPVRVYRFSDGVVVGSGNCSSSNNTWAWTTITSIPVTANTSYVVAIQYTGSASRFLGVGDNVALPSTPTTNTTIHDSRWNTNSNTAMPTETVSTTIGAGAVDIEFSTGGSTTTVTPTNTGDFRLSGDIQATTADKGIITKSPDGLICRRIGINNAGSVVATAVTCP